MYYNKGCRYFECTEPKCYNIARFGDRENVSKKACYLHFEDNMKKIHGVQDCILCYKVGKHKKGSYTKGIYWYCKEHVSKYDYGYSKDNYCKTCLQKGTQTKAEYSYPGKQKTECEAHKRENMYKYTHRYCNKSNKCMKKAVYRNPFVAGLKACAKHATKEMILEKTDDEDLQDKKSEKKILEGMCHACFKQNIVRKSSYETLKKGIGACWYHREKNMVSCKDVVRICNICRINGKKRTSFYGYSSERVKYCYEHKRYDMKCFPNKKFCYECHRIDIESTSDHVENNYGFCKMHYILKEHFGLKGYFGQEHFDEESERKTEEESDVLFLEETTPKKVKKVSRKKCRKRKLQFSNSILMTVSEPAAKSSKKNKELDLKTYNLKTYDLTSSDLFETKLNEQKMTIVPNTLFSMQSLRKNNLIISLSQKKCSVCKKSCEELCRGKCMKCLWSTSKRTLF